MAQSLRRLLHAAILAVVLVLFSVSAQRATAALTAAQTAATLDFLQGFPGSLRTLGWSGTDYCSWSGVTCDSDGNVSVNLSGRGLTGYMPDVNEDIDGTNIMVVAVDLSNNNGITGNIKDEWANLKNLRSLDLSTTHLYGNIPVAWNGMSSLEEVYISNTYACRSLPAWTLTTLKTVEFKNNNLAGTLASSWSTMTNLTSVSITGNNFCGCVPDTWTSTVLTNAAAAVGGNLVASNCGTSNTCGKDAFKCPNAAAAPAQLTVVLVAVLLAAAAVVGF